MKLALVSGLMASHAVEIQLERIEQYCEEAADCDIIVFGEAYLQGFDRLTWSYDRDKKRAVEQNSPVINRIQSIAQIYQLAISIGFFEKNDEKFFSSQLYIGATGDILSNYRRISQGWKDKNAGKQYQEGEDFEVFDYQGRRLVTAICGDLWHDNLLNRLTTLEYDICLWPVYIDYTPEEWQTAQHEYAEQTKRISKPIYLVNSYSTDKQEAYGGVYLFEKGQITPILPIGSHGIVKIEH
ncbi:carbon-nitrogen hydrolase family protein [Streptococcus sp. ZJ93]|uniref:carbon-nitrogen hydrolase family protein n=1 Tax=Streptococcus handemini TaxID=3161188 RepID=UPI0034D45FF2